MPTDPQSYRQFGASIADALNRASETQGRQYEFLASMILDQKRREDDLMRAFIIEDRRMQNERQLIPLRAQQEYDLLQRKSELETKQYQETTGVLQREIAKQTAETTLEAARIQKQPNIFTALEKVLGVAQRNFDTLTDTMSSYDSEIAKLQAESIKMGFVDPKTKIEMSRLASEKDKVATERIAIANEMKRISDEMMERIGVGGISQKTMSGAADEFRSEETELERLNRLLGE